MGGSNMGGLMSATWRSAFRRLRIMHDGMPQRLGH
jgi:hypothetical protein